MKKLPQESIDDAVIMEEKELKQKDHIVDNSGKGNCMYYAYAISLMHYLREKQDLDQANRVFNRLNLNNVQKESLKTLLNLELHPTLEEKSIKSIVEPILGTACRNLAGQAVTEEFKNRPNGSQLVAAVTGGLRILFSSIVKGGTIPENFNAINLIQQISNELKDDAIFAAELYKVTEIYDLITEFANDIDTKNAIINKFKKQWPKVLQEKKQNAIDSSRTISEKDELFYMQNLMDTIIQEHAVKFFTKNNFKNLETYENHLKKEYIWGSEETLLSLHRKIQNEQMIHNELNNNWDIVSEDPIHLTIFKDGKNINQDTKTKDMIINNKGNNHWVSLIPSHQLNLAEKLAEKNYKMLVNVNDTINKEANEISKKFSVSNYRGKLLIAQVLNEKDNIPKLIENLEEDIPVFFEVLNNYNKKLLEIQGDFNKPSNSVKNKQELQDLKNYYQKLVADTEQYLRTIQNELVALKLQQEEFSANDDYINKPKKL